MSPRRIRADEDVTGRRERPLRITVDGETVDGVAGQTLAGVLLAAGRLAWRRGPSGAPRGVFCGIGVCFDCLVTVNGERDVRACRRRARDGDAVATQSRETPPTDPGRRTTPRPGGAMTSRHTVVVGAGPAGLAAAEARAGRRRPGDADRRGRPARRPVPPDAARGVRGHPPGADPARLARLRPAAAAPCSHIRAAPGGPRPRCGRWSDPSRGDPARRGSTWCAGPPTASDRRRLVLDPDALVLAAGAHDRMLPFPGWELPGVYTAGAAQALAKGERVRGRRPGVVAGTGPFLLPVAASLLEAGAQVAAVLEANRRGRPGAGLVPAALGAAAQAGKAGELAAVRSARWRGTACRTGRAAPSSRPAATAGSRRSSPPGCAPTGRWCRGTERTLAVDAVCVTHGFTPQLELPVAAGCALRGTRRTVTDAPDGFVAVDDDQRTSRPGVYAAGEITGIAGRPRRPRGRRPRGVARRRRRPGRSRPRPAAPQPRPGPRLRRPPRRARTPSAPAGPAGCAPKPSSAAARRPTTRALCRAAADPAGAADRVAKLADPGRARPVPGPDLRPHRRRTPCPAARHTGRRARSLRRRCARRRAAARHLAPATRRPADPARRTRRRSRAVRPTAHPRSLPDRGEQLMSGTQQTALSAASSWPPPCPTARTRRARRPRRRLRPVRRALPLAGRQRLPRRRPQRLAGRVLVADRRGTPHRRPDRDRGGRGGRRRWSSACTASGSHQARHWAEAAAEDGADGVLCLPPTMYRANRGEVAGALRGRRLRRPAGDGLQQPHRHQGRPDPGPARRDRADRQRRRREGVLRRRPAGAGDQGAGAGPGGRSAAPTTSCWRAC